LKAASCDMPLRAKTGPEIRQPLRNGREEARWLETESLGYNVEFERINATLTALDHCDVRFDFAKSFRKFSLAEAAVRRAANTLSVRLARRSSTRRNLPDAGAAPAIGGDDGEADGGQ